METATATKSKEPRDATLVLYSPHKLQLKFHNSRARFLVAAWGRQTGKSTACLNDAIHFAWSNPGVTIWFISPTHDQAKVQYRRLIGMLWSCKGVISKKNQTELRIKLINQSQIVFKSGESFDNLRGETLHRVYIDEVRDQHPDLFNMVIYPMLLTTGGSARFVSTPNGFDQFYDMKLLCEQDNEGEWEFMSAPSTANPLISAKELERSRKTMTDAQYRQEIMAEFLDMTQGKAYLSASSDNHSLECPFAIGKLINNNLPLILGLDFNLNPMAWGVLQKKIDTWWMFDELYIKGTHTPAAAKALVEKLLGYKEEFGYDVKTFGLVIVGDATGKAQQRAAAGQSDYDILFAEIKKADIPFVDQTPDSNPKVKDRVNTMNMKLKDAEGTPHFFYHPKRCPAFKKDMERVVWKQSGSDAVYLDQTTNPELTHMSDAIGYPICALSPIKFHAKVPSLRIIKR